jgi:hypothetical protein
MLAAGTIGGGVAAYLAATRGAATWAYAIFGGAMVLAVGLSLGGRVRGEDEKAALAKRSPRGR